MIQETRLQVRYGEVDRMGVVHHPHYLDFFEVGRTDFLRALGRSYREVEEAGILLVVVDVGVQYHRPAGYDDVLLVRTRLAELSGVRLRFEYDVERPSDGVRVATGWTTLAACGPEGRPLRLPPEMRRMLEGVAQPPLAGKDRLPSAVQGGIL